MRWSAANPPPESRATRFAASIRAVRSRMPSRSARRNRKAISTRRPRSPRPPRSKSPRNGETAESAEAENRRRRRRRRGRGRNFEREGSGVEANGEQPSDEGLETMAAIGGDLILPVATESAEEGGFEPSSEEGSEGGRRGRGRWRRRGRGGRNGENAEFNGDWRPSAEARDESEAGAPAVETSGEASAEGPAQQGNSAPVFAPLPEWGGETPSAPESALAAEFAPPFAPDFASDFAAPPRGRTGRACGRGDRSVGAGAQSGCGSAATTGCCRACGARAETGAAGAGIAGHHPGGPRQAQALGLVGEGQGQSDRPMIRSS